MYWWKLFCNKFKSLYNYCLIVMRICHIDGILMYLEWLYIAMQNHFSRFLQVLKSTCMETKNLITIFFASFATMCIRYKLSQYLIFH